MSLMIGVISYLPEDYKVRLKRLTAVRMQLDWLHSIYPDYVVTIVAQNYRQEELFEDDRAQVYYYSEGIGPGNARNVILELFYKSDYDFLLLCDDDSICYPYYSYQDFMHHIAYNSEDFTGVDSVIPVEPEYYPFKKQVWEDGKNKTHYKFRPRYNNSGAALVFLRNIVKYGGKPIYFNSIDASNGEGREDIDFNLRWIMAGYTSYEMQTWIKKSLCFDDSSIFGADTKKRDQVIAYDLTKVVEQFAEYGLAYKGNHIDWKTFNRRWNKTQSVLYIPRKCAIMLSDREIPKYVKDKPKGLF